MEELDAIGTVEQIKSAWTLIVPAWVPFPVGWALTQIENDGKSALFSKKLKLASAWTVDDQVQPNVLN